MFHMGHAKVLEQAKKMFKHVYLIVGVSGDDETWRLKGKTVMYEDERRDTVWHWKWADEVIMPWPWIITLDFVEKHNIDYVAHDDVPYNSAGSGDIYATIKEAGKFLATQRTEGISTSDIIMRIIKDYDKYIWRSLERGYSAKELGISETKAFRVRLKEKIIPGIRQTFSKWRKNSSIFIDKFVSQFDPSFKSKKQIKYDDKDSKDEDEISDFDY